MRALVMIASVVTILGAVGEARADVEYPYCLIPSRFTVGTCTYVTLEQCNQAASGNIGSCAKNPRYTASMPPPPRSRSRY